MTSQNIYEALKAGRYPKNKNGDQIVVTRDGSKVTILSLNYSYRNENTPILGEVDDILRSWNKNGFSFDNEKEFGMDLMPLSIAYKFSICFVIHNKTGKAVYTCTDYNWDEYALNQYRNSENFSLVYKVMEGVIPNDNLPLGPTSTMLGPTSRTIIRI